MKQLTDLELCIKYQETGFDKFYNELLRRYHNSVYKMTNLIYNSVPKDDLGLEWDDIYLEILMCIQKAMKFVKVERITEIEKFRFNVIFQKFCTSYRQDLYTYLNAKKRGTTTNEDGEVVHSITTYCDHDALSNVEAVAEKEDNFKEFYDSLTQKEQILVERLLDKKTWEELYKEFGWQYTDIKKSVHQKYKNHLELIRS